jgi:hypothetical protein
MEVDSLFVSCRLCMIMRNGTGKSTLRTVGSLLVICQLQLPSNHALLCFKNSTIDIILP